MAVSKKVESPVDQEPEEFLIKSGAGHTGLEFSPWYVNDDVTQYRHAAMLSNRDVGIKGKDIGGSVNSAVATVEVMHPAVAHKEDAQLCVCLAQKDKDVTCRSLNLSLIQRPMPLQVS